MELFVPRLPRPGSLVGWLVGLVVVVGPLSLLAIAAAAAAAAAAALNKLKTTPKKIKTAHMA